MKTDDSIENLYIYGYIRYMAENKCPRSNNTCNFNIAKMQKLCYHTFMKFLDQPKTKRRNSQ